MADHHARALRRQLAERPTAVGNRDGVLDRLRRLCAVVAKELSASGAAVSILAEGGMRAAMVSSDPVSERVEDLQHVLGEGPGVDALATGRPVLIGTFDAVAMGRWPVYGPSVHDIGIRAVFAFPLQVGAAQLGALDVYRTTAGPLSADELAQAFNYSQIILSTLIDGQDPAASEADVGGVAETVEHHSAIFQAQGMVMVQLDASLVEAMARMRAYAFTENRNLIDVAHDVVARTLSFEPDALEIPTE